MRSVAFASVGQENAAVPQLFDLVSQVLTEPDVLNGPRVASFEALVARAASREFAIATGSGTDALFFALLAAGIGPGDEVLVPAFSFVATASAVARTGARASFVDVHPVAPSLIGAPFTMDFAAARRTLTRSTRAILWVNLFGGWSDPGPVEAFASQHGLIVIEDAAQSFGATWKDLSAGSIGVAAAYSFDRLKVLAGPGTGGAVVTNSNEVAARVRRLRWHGLRGHEAVELGYNSQMSELTAAILSAKARLLPTWLAMRRAVAKRYDEAFADLPFAVPQWPEQVEHARHKYVVVTKHRENLQRHLAAQGVQTRRHYDRPLPHHAFLGRHGDAASIPVTQALCADILSLPIHPFLSGAEVDHVIGSVRAFFD